MAQMTVITRWKLEHQNFGASYGSAGVVGVVWSCTVISHHVVDETGKRLP